MIQRLCSHTDRHPVILVFRITIAFIPIFSPCFKRSLITFKNLNCVLESPHLWAKPLVVHIGMFIDLEIYLFATFALFYSSLKGHTIAYFRIFCFQ